MLEPVAAVFSHSSRFSLTFGNAMRRTARTSLTPDFFLPQPRRVKGKGKAVDDSYSHQDVSLAQCHEWSFDSKPVWCYSKYNSSSVAEKNTNI